MPGGHHLGRRATRPSRSPPSRRGRRRRGSTSVAASGVLVFCSQARSTSGARVAGDADRVAVAAPQQGVVEAAGLFEHLDGRRHRAAVLDVDRHLQPCREARRTASAKRGGRLPSARTRSRSKERARRQPDRHDRTRRPERHGVVHQHGHPVAGEPHVDLDRIGARLGRADDAGEAVLGVVERKRAVGDDRARSDAGSLGDLLGPGVRRPRAPALGPAARRSCMWLTQMYRPATAVTGMIWAPVQHTAHMVRRYRRSATTKGVAASRPSAAPPTRSSGRCTPTYMRADRHGGRDGERGPAGLREAARDHDRDGHRDRRVATRETRSRPAVRGRARRRAGGPAGPARRRPSRSA